MTGLIEEIQRDAMNERQKVSSTLRKVRSAASKLNLSNLGQWVEHELNGYPSVSDLPAYRLIRGRPHALNPYRGWIPIHVKSDRDQELISSCPLLEPIVALEDLLASNKSDFFQIPMASEMVRILNAGAGVTFGTMANHISIGQVTAVVERVRNTILDWALEMERSGITGSGLSFSDSEKTAAQKAVTTITIGAIGSFAGNLGSGNTSRDIHLDQSERQPIFQFTERVRKELPTLIAEGADEAKLVGALNELDSELQSSEPRRSKLRSLLGDARMALVGAAGSLAAEGAMALIDAALQTLG